MATPSTSRKRSQLSREPSKRRPSPSLRLDSPELYLNPHLSLLAFQRRVLEEAKDPATPLLERVKFLSILGSNMDEFFMVRVAGLWQQIETRTTEISMDGRSPSEQLELIRHEVTSIMARNLPAMARRIDAGIARRKASAFLTWHELNPQQKVAVDDYFRRVVYPVLTPLAVDQGRPFPAHFESESQYCRRGQQRRWRGAIRPHQGSGFAAAACPAAIRSIRDSRLSGWKTPSSANLRLLFPEMEIVKADMFHLTRDAELAIQELETDDLLESVQEAVWRRRFRDAVRLQVNPGMPQTFG